MFSSIHSFANWPDWISARIFFISFLVSSVTIRDRGQVAILCRVADEYRNVRDAPLVDQVHDELELMETFE